MDETEVGAPDAPDSDIPNDPGPVPADPQDSVDAAPARTDQVVISRADLDALIAEKVDQALADRPAQMDPDQPMDHRLVVVRDHGRAPTESEMLRGSTFDQVTARIRELFDDPDQQVTHIEHVPELGNNVTYIHPDLVPKR